MEIDGFLYETLSPLAGDSPSSQTPSTPPPLLSSTDSEPYVVFRNEIPLSSIRWPSSETAAPEYFSLDTTADAEEPATGTVTTPSPAATPAPVPEPARTLEGVWFRPNFRFKSPMLQLHKEILDFCDFLSPTPEEQASRNAAIACVFDVIKYIWPNSKIEVFGSFKTGLYLPTSDIDVVILGSDIKTPQLGLHALAKALSQRGIAKKMQVIAKARVPIVKFVEKKSSVAFDISFDVENGPKAADFIKDAVSKWPPLRPLCLILKVFLQQRELNEVYTGGIGSYALLVMLIAMMRSLREQQASPEHNLGVLLVKFFELFGCKLNTSDVGISCSGEGTFFSKTNKGFSVKGKPFLIAIEDPQAPENDIGKNSFSYFQVKSAFAMAYSTLTNAKAILSLGPNRSILGTIIRPDPVLLERKGGSNGEVTFNNLLPGAGEPLQLQDQQEIYCNWQLDEEEEPLPRGNGIAEDENAPSSSGKKRKALKEEKPAKKAKANGKVGNAGHEESRSGSRKEKGKKKRYLTHYQDRNQNNGFGY
ncbi:Polynucleotide adenylyltransferase [Bertholletia excelsa]